MALSGRVRSNVRRHRALADGMTQQELADRVGVTRQTVHSIETGKYRPTVELALRLGRALGARVEELFEDEDDDEDEEDIP